MELVLIPLIFDFSLDFCPVFVGALFALLSFPLDALEPVGGLNSLLNNFEGLVSLLVKSADPVLYNFLLLFHLALDGNVFTW